MTFFFSLTKYVSIPILIEWLEPNDTVTFDTAICNQVHRKSFLVMVRQQYAQFQRRLIQSAESIPLSYQMIQWIVSRNFDVPNLGRLLVTKDSLRTILSRSCDEDEFFSEDYFLLFCQIVSAMEFNDIEYGPLFRKFLSYCNDLVDIKVRSTSSQLCEALCDCFSLTALDLGSVTTIDENILCEIIFNCGGLKSLNVAGCQNLNKRFMARVIVHGRNICSLAMDECSTSKSVLLAYCLHSKCKLVSFSHREMSDLVLNALLSYLGGDALTKLDVSCSDDVSDNSICDIGLNCCNLTDLNVSACCNLLEMGIAAIACTLPLLHVLNLENIEKINDEQFSQLTDNCACLRELYLQANENITGDGLLTITRLSGLCKLVMIAMKRLTDTTLVSILSACRSLTELDVSVSNITDAVVSGGGEVFAGLKKLNLSGSMIGDLTLSAIGSYCYNLVELNISSCRRIQTAGLINVVEGCRKLRCLDVSYCGFASDKVLQAIPPSSRLKTLNLRCCTRVTRVGLNDLTRKLPRLVNISSDVHLYDPGLVRSPIHKLVKVVE